MAARSKLLSTDQLLTAGGVTRETLYLWVAQRFIERPTFTAGSDGSVIPVWPREALERIRFVGKQQEGLTPREVANLVRERWPANK